MAYKLRIAGQPRDRYKTPEEAVARAREVVRQDADSVVEIIDLTTGNPYALAAGAGDREALSGKIGF